MYRFATTFARTLALATLASLVGCDDLEDVDIDELEADELELRDSLLPVAGIPFDHIDVKQAFSVPMQPVSKFKSKLMFELHGPTNLAYTWTPDPTGALNTILVDSNGLSPYSGNVPAVDEAECNELLSVHSYEVPITPSLSACAAVESGCCEYICYQWGGYPFENNGQNEVVAVDNETFEFEVYNEEYGNETIWGTFVESDPARMSWNMNQPNGGHSLRSTVCGCNCYLP